MTAVLALFLLLPRLTESFAIPSGINALWLALAYIWFSVSVLVVRKLEATGARRFPYPLAPKARMGLALLFAIGLALAISHQLGYLDTMLEVNPRELGAGESAAFFVLAPGAWLGFSLLYVIFLSFNVKENIRPNPLREGLALLGINGMALLAAAELRVVLHLLGVNGRLPIFLLITLGLLLLIAPPRLIYQRQRPAHWPLISFLLFLSTAALPL